MTTKPPSWLAASGPADEESEQITKEHNDVDDPAQDITIDPSEDVTVEATEDVTTEAVSRTPHPTLRGGGTSGPTPGTVGTSAAQRAPTLLGVPIQSLPLPGVTSAHDSHRDTSYDDEITVLAPPAPIDPLAMLDELDRPSITDDDEEETKVEPAEAAMKAAESIDDVTTALSAQASLEREKALRRSAPATAPGGDDDLEFADPESEEQEQLEQQGREGREGREEQQEQEEESLDDELDDDDEVISAGGAIEEEEDDDGSNDGVATATFMKPADSTGLSGLLNPRRPPTGNPYGRDGFGARLPTPYPPPQATVPAPATSPFASRLGPAPTGTPYPGRGTGTPMTAIQIPAPSGKAAMETEPGFFQKLKEPVSVPRFGLIALVGGSIVAGFGFGNWIGGKSTPAGPTVIVAKPTAAQTPALPVVEPVAGSATAPATATATATETKPPAPAETAATKPTTPAPTVTDIPGPAPSENPNDTAPEAGMWKPAKKPPAPKPHKVAVEGSEDLALKPRPIVEKSPKPVVPKAAVEKAPKPATPAAPKPAPAAKPGKKPAKAWVDPFAN